MAGNSQTGQKLVATMIKKYGSYEAYRQAMRERASKGGSVKGTGGGFASEIIGDDGLTGRERARVVGVIGGARSKRRKKNA